MNWYFTTCLFSPNGHDRCCFFEGGDSELTDHGEEYAAALAEWVDKEALLTLLQREGFLFF